MATLFSVSWAYKYFMGSLLSIPLHRLGRISFSANLETSVAMATLFWVSWTCKYFYGFFAFHTPAQTAADKLFGNTWQQVLP